MVAKHVLNISSPKVRLLRGENGHCLFLKLWMVTSWYYISYFCNFKWLQSNVKGMRGKCSIVSALFQIYSLWLLQFHPHTESDLGEAAGKDVQRLQSALITHPSGPTMFSEPYASASSQLMHGGTCHNKQNCHWHNLRNKILMLMSAIREYFFY